MGPAIHCIYICAYAQTHKVMYPKSRCLLFVFVLVLFVMCEILGAVSV